MEGKIWIAIDAISLPGDEVLFFFLELRALLYKG